MPELSIIVPVYKVEPYLRRCIDSILAQTFRDFELILVDDGSPDNCGAICDEYAAKDSRIIVIHQKNQGVSAARNAGLDIAKGTYLGFVDSDDWIEPEMYETMISTAKVKNVGLVVCDVMINNDAGKVEDVELTHYTYHGVLYDLFSKPSKLRGYCFNKLYSTSKIKTCRFISGLKMWEDLTFLMDLYLVNRLDSVHINREYYHYYFNDSSVTRSEQALDYNYKHFGKYIFAQMQKYAPNLAGKALDHFLDSSVSLIGLYRRNQSLGAVRREMNILWIKTVILGWILYAKYKKLLPQSRQNRYLYEGVIKS